MSNPLNIDLTGIPEARWTEREELCADCRRDVGMSEDEEDDDEETIVPLLLWRKHGREMLRLCWRCAQKRMGHPAK